MNRRRTLQALIATYPLLRMRSATAGGGIFRHGVASGDPDTSSVVLWTRVSIPQSNAAVGWEIAVDRDFSRRVAEGSVQATAERDHTVKVLASGLDAGTRYFYRFSIGGQTSPVGRTRTLPEGTVAQVNLALASCSNFVFGHFNAYDDIARDEGIDFVLHTGDYLYEYGDDGWGGEVGQAIGRRHHPPHETISLADYRLRHAQYKADAGSIAMHAVHPLVVCWDDHEIANNPWKEGAQNHQPATEGAWPVRRSAALRAWYEWMPVRDPAPGSNPEDFWRVYTFGNLATLVTLESRHGARSKQIDYADYHTMIRDRPSRDAFLREILGMPGRSMLSQGMEKALGDALAASVAQDQPWRLIGNASPMARMPVPDLTDIGFVLARAGNASIDELLWKGRWNLPFYTDTWDGYPWARQRFYTRCQQAGARDLLVLSGDSHSFWLNDLADDTGNPMGMEIGTAGITSPGDFLDMGFSPVEAGHLDRLLADSLAEVRWTDNLHTGWVKVELHPGYAEVNYTAISSNATPAYRSQVLKSVRIRKAHGRLEPDIE